MTDTIITISLPPPTTTIPITSQPGGPQPTDGHCCHNVAAASTAVKLCQPIGGQISLPANH